MADTPPVGSGLARVEVRFATSRLFWNDRNCAAVGWSTFCHVMLLIQRASNFESDRSSSAEATAGSIAKTRTASEAPETARPVKSGLCSSLFPKLLPCWLMAPEFPCSSAIAIHSLSVIIRAGRSGIEHVRRAGADCDPPRWANRIVRPLLHAAARKTHPRKASL